MHCGCSCDSAEPFVGSLAVFCKSEHGLTMGLGSHAVKLSLRWFLKYESRENPCAQTHTGSAVSLGKTLKQPRRMDTLRNIHEINMQIKTTSQEQTEKSYVSGGMGHCDRLHTIQHPGRNKQQRPNTLVVGGHGYAHMKNMGLQSVKLFLRELQ